MTGNADGKVVFEIDLDTKSFDEEIKNTEKELKELIEDYKELTQGVGELPGIDKDSKKARELRIEIEKVRNKYVDLKKKQLGLQEGMNENVTGFKDILSKVTDSSGKILKKILRWGVALFGIRSAYTAIRQAMSTISQYDNTMKSNIDYIRYAVAMSLKPIIEWIINQVYKLMQYINYIAQRWFGKNLFENAGAKAFKEANKNAKEYQKTLAGFDEMDILKKVDNANEINPTFDLSKQLSDRDVPTWIKWIGDHKDVFQAVAEGFAILFGAKAIAAILSATGAIIGSKTIGLMAGKGLLGVYALLLLIGGVTFYKLFQSLSQLREKTKEINNMWKEISGTINKISGKQKENKQLFDENDNKGILTDKQIKDYAFNVKEQINKSINMLKEMLKETTGGYVTSGIEKAFEETYKNLFTEIEEIRTRYNQGFITNEDYEKALKNINTFIEEVEKTYPEGHMMRYFLHIDDKEFNNLKTDINKELGKVKLNALKVEIQANPDKFTETLENIRNLPLIGKTLYNQISKIISNLKTKKNAMGGIINLPNRGVTLGYTGMTRQVGGEAGYEGLIPMDNASQMELIGRAVAKYTTINLTNITKLDNREIAREQKKINAENDFAYNR